MTDNLKIRFSEKCLKDRLITSRVKVKPVLEFLMKAYINGSVKVEKPIDFLPKSEGSKSRVQLDRDIKSDFEFLAWENGLVSQPHFGNRALELIMQMYLDGGIEIDKKLWEKHIGKKQ